MDHMLRCAQKGWDILLAAALPLLLGGLLWTGLDLFTFGLLTGPALVGLFTIALKAHEGRVPEATDIFAAFLGDVGAALLAGLVFIAPFKLFDFIADRAGWVPLAISVLLAVWFALGMQVFAALADAPNAGLGAALRKAWSLADAAPRGRFSRLSQQLVYGSGAYLLVVLGKAFPGIGFLTLAITVPAVACLFTAWYVHAALPSEAEAAAEPTEGDAGRDEAPPAPKRKARKKTPSRRPAAKPGDGED